MCRSEYQENLSLQCDQLLDLQVRYPFPTPTRTQSTRSPIALSVNIRMPNCSPAIADIANSLELRFLIDRHIAARRVGHDDLANVYAHAAEGLLTAGLPTHADAIASVASRKGDGRLIGSALAQRLSPMTAAAIFIVWSCRQARRPAIQTLSNAFRKDPAFNETVRLLCAGIFTPTIVPAPSPPMTTTSIEVASPRQR